MNKNASNRSPQYRSLANVKSKFQEFHEKVANTREERTLEKHEKYKRAWSNQMYHSIKIRDKLQGDVNEAQAVNDLAITEKMDEYAVKDEMRRVLSASFEQRSDSYGASNWVSSLRNKTIEAGDEVVTASPLVNKRNLITNLKRGSDTDLEVRDTTKEDFLVQCGRKDDKKNISRWYQFKTPNSRTVSQNLGTCPVKSEIP